MIVVADASPLNYLIQVECDSLIRDLYGSVLVPSSVMEELNHPSAPAAVAAWLLRLPSWIDVRTVLFRDDDVLQTLDLGEREAIQLAQEQHANLLLIDERRGRLEARRRGISTTGTLGILLAGGQRRLISPESVFQRLIEETNFRVAPSVKERFEEECRKFRGPE
jgi:predicted nucleic acid-binding protein